MHMFAYRLLFQFGLLDKQVTCLSTFLFEIGLLAERTRIHKFDPVTYMNKLGSVQNLLAILLTLSADPVTVPLKL